MTKTSNIRYWRNVAKRLPLLLEAFGYLVVARTAVHFLPFTRLSRLIALPSRPGEEAPIQIVGPVCRSVTSVANHPRLWAVCLPQALAGHWMLRRRGVASVVCFGVGRDPAAKLGAHAWLRVADRIVLGQQAMAGFTPIAEFPARSAQEPSGRDQRLAS